MEFSLRPYQMDALQISKDKFQAGVNRQIIVLPTGMGKTVCLAQLPLHHGIDKRVMVVVHREELAQQTADKFSKWNPDSPVGIEMAGSYAGDAQIVIASVATVGRKNSQRLAEFHPDTFGAIITDEVHHCTADTYVNIYEHFKLVGDEPDKSRLSVGLTATPKRSDGQALAQVFDEIVYQMSIKDAIQQGWLVDIIGIKVETDILLNNIHTQQGDFAVGELSKAVNTPARNHLVVQSWLKHGQDRKTIVFAVDVAHAQSLAAAFQQYGVAAQAIWGTDKYRADKLKAHREGHLKVLVNVGILTEGYDDPTVSCVVMARPTKSQLLFVQQAGRGTRLEVGINNLLEARAAGSPITKPDMLLIDVVDNTDKHSLVTLASIFGIPAKVDLHGMPVTRAIEKMEQAEKLHPEIDFRQLRNLDDLNEYIRQVALFENKWPDEVEANSILQWHKTGETEYTLYLPKGERVRIEQDMLDKWAISGVVKQNKFYRNDVTDLPEAFKAAEDIVTMFGRDLLTLLRRKSKWHSEPITPPQKSLVRRLYRYNPDVLKALDQLTKGQAAKLIKDFHKAIPIPN